MLIVLRLKKLTIWLVRATFVHFRGQRLSYSEKITDVQTEGYNN
jgi:hypothetical protein